MMGNVIVAGDAKADAYALLSLAQDPESTKLRLDQITAAGKEYHDLISKNADILLQIQKENLALADAQRKLEQDKADFEQLMKDAKENLKKDKSRVETDRQDSYDLNNKNNLKANELQDLSDKLDARDISVAYRERQVQGREEAVSKREAIVDSLKQDYENKLNQLKGLING